LNEGTGEEPPADEDGLASRHLSPLERPTWGNREEEGSLAWEEDRGGSVERVAAGPRTGSGVGLVDERALGRGGVGEAIVLQPINKYFNFTTYLGSGNFIILDKKQ